MKQRWIRLFQINERSWLEENLNMFLKEYPDAEINVWVQDNMWFASAIYSYPEAPTYPKPEPLEEFSIS